MQDASFLHLRKLCPSLIIRAGACLRAGKGLMDIL